VQGKRRRTWVLCVSEVTACEWGG